MPHLLSLGIALLSLTSCVISTPPRHIPHPHFPISENTQRTPLLVFSHGHHTGLVLPRQALQSELPEITNRLTGDWLEFGWGDEGFYRSEKINLTLGFRALALPSPSVIHVATSSQPLHITYAYAPAKLFSLSEQQKQILVRRLKDQLTQDAQGNLKPLGPGRYGISQFYRARASFFFPRTCNAWTASHLRAIGYQAHAVTAPGLFRDLKKLRPN